MACTCSCCLPSASLTPQAAPEQYTLKCPCTQTTPVACGVFFRLIAHFTSKQSRASEPAFRIHSMAGAHLNPCILLRSGKMLLEEEESRNWPKEAVYPHGSHKTSRNGRLHSGTGGDQQWILNMTSVLRSSAKARQEPWTHGTVVRTETGILLQGSTATW